MLNTVILDYAINKANQGILKDSGIELKQIPGIIDYANEFIVAESVCERLGVGEKFINFEFGFVFRSY